MRIFSFAKLVIVFLAGALISYLVGLWHPYVTVRLRNNDLRSVDQIFVTYKNSESQGSFRPYLNNPIKTGEQLEVHFYVEGEGSFSVKAIYSDSSHAEGVPGYIERGELVKVDIIGTEIKRNFK